MTCIVGLVDKGKVYIGGDSAAIDGNGTITVRADRKVFRNGDFIIGFTSSFRMGQLLSYALKPPRHCPGDDIYGYMVTTFIDAVRDCLKDAGFTRKDDSGIEKGGFFLVGYSGRLFQIDSDFQVGESVGGFNAIGCGDMIALGAMKAAENKPPRERIETALSAAAEFSSGVCAPFHIEEI